MTNKSGLYSDLMTHLELASAPSLDHHVHNILLPGAQPEMGGPGAQRVVARVAHVHTNGDRSVQTEPDVAMNPPDGVVDVDFAVSTGLRATGPDPTTIFFDQAGKDANQWVGAIGRSCPNRTVDRSVGSPPLIVRPAQVSGVVGAITSIRRANSCHDLNTAYLS